MTKLKRAKLSKQILPPSWPSDNIVPLDHAHLVLQVKHHTNREDVLTAVNVYRALYHGVPPANSIGQSIMHKERLPLVQNIYEWLTEVNNQNGSTAKTYFGLLVHFFRFCDANECKAELTESTISAYAQYIRAIVCAKPESVSTPRQMATTFSIFLAWVGHEDLAMLLPRVVRKNAIVSKTSAYSDAEQIGVVRDLFRVFNLLASRLKTGGPTTCPFDQPVMSWDVAPTNRTAWYNKLTATAFFLIASFVGDNRTSLRKLRRSDVAGREFHFDKTINLYRLTTTKGRQGGQRNSWDLGFTQRGRDFFKAYIHCLDLLGLPENAYLFPCFIHGQYRGALCDYDLQRYTDWFTARCPHGVRPLIGRFRQSKADGLMADTNSIAIVAEGLNNLKTTTAKHYMNGNPHNNRNRLGSAAEALELTARGATIEEAREVVEAKYGKPLRMMEIAARGGPEPIPTKVGTRCKEPFGEKAQRLKRELVKGGLLTEHESIACFKFLDCFECEYRALVAEVDDIWCMLSFSESLQEALQRPTINHYLPVAKVRDVIVKTQAMLANVEHDYPDVYAAAVNKLNYQAHPLWSDEYSVSDLYEIW
ncbi:hypothetical protein ACEUBB_10870 [Aeromonas rivipollensis]|uniref:hypothetical protein n=1 Tax=Aeromonas rivipollensis TaxID=948519 RepID=UPI0038D03409